MTPETYRLFDPSVFCTGLGEDTTKMVALPLRPAQSVVEMDRGRVVRSGTGAVFEVPTTAVKRYMGYGRPEDTNLGTNIASVTAPRPQSMLKRRVLMVPQHPLEKAFRTSQKLTCVRLTRSHGTNERAEVYLPGKGWSSYSGLWNSYHAVGAVIRELLASKFGLEGSRWNFNHDITKEERTTYANLLERVGRLNLVSGYKNEKYKVKSLDDCLTLVEHNVGLMVNSKARPVAPEDLVDVGLLDDVAHAHCMVAEGWGSEGWPMMYRLRLTPVLAVSYDELTKGELPTRVLEAHEGTTVEELLNSVAAGGMKLADDENMNWVQLAIARVYPVEEDKF